MDRARLVKDLEKVFGAAHDRCDDDGPICADLRRIEVAVKAELRRLEEVERVLRETLREADARIAYDLEWRSMADVARAVLSEVDRA